MKHNKKGVNMILNSSDKIFSKSIPNEVRILQFMIQRTFNTIKLFFILHITISYCVNISFNRFLNDIKINNQRTDNKVKYTDYKSKNKKLDHQKYLEG